METVIDGVTRVGASLLNGYKGAIEACEPALGNPASSGRMLVSTDAGVRSWGLPYVSPTTTEGDLVVRGAAADGRLGVGSEGDVLTVASGVPAWHPPVAVNPAAFCARLTLTSGTAITTSDVTGAGTIYLTGVEGLGNLLALYNGTAWVYHTLATEVSLALADLTDGKTYDVFLHDASGTLTLTRSAAWANDTTRTDALAVQDGIRVLASNHTKRLVGTFVATGTGTTEDSGFSVSKAGKRYLLNEHNRVPKSAYAEVAWGSWSYSGTWRPANNDSSVVTYGLCAPKVILGGQIGGTQGSGAIYQLALGDGSTSSPAAMVWAVSYQSGQMSSNVNLYLAEGRHTFYVLERAPSGSASPSTAWMELVFWV